MDKQLALFEYEAKKEARIERLKARAEKKRRESEAALKRARQMADVIPLGQPILVGHHSEGRDRRYRDRIHNTYGKGFEAMEQAEELERRAEAAEKNRTISSDDPEAITKLREKLASLQETQEYMKRINKAHRAYSKTGNMPAGLTEKERDAIKNYQPAYSWEPNPFAPFQLSNNNANIKRVEKRIKELEARQEQDTTEKTVGDIRIVDNVEANRLQIFFPGKPDADTRKTLKSFGFRWAPSNGCWQAYRNNRAHWALEKLGLNDQTTAI